MKELIIKYENKIKKCTDDSTHFRKLIEKAKNGSGMDIDDLIGELENIKADRRIYVQFVSDLKSIN